MEILLYENMAGDIKKTYNNVWPGKQKISGIRLFCGIWKSRITFFDKIMFSISDIFHIRYRVMKKIKVLNAIKYLTPYRIRLIKEVKKLCKKYNLSSPYQDFYSLRSTLLVLYEVIAKDQYQIKKLVRKDDIVIDAGANMGAFTILASNYTGNKIVSFEPTKSTFNALKKNIKNFGLKNVILVNKGLGDKIKSSKLLVNKFSYGGNTIIDSEKKFTIENPEEDIKIITLDSFVNESGIKKIDVIKVDVEGYELKLLKGARETIKRFKPRIVISAYHCPSDKKVIPQYILNIRKDYKFELLSNTREEDFIFW